MMYPSESVVIGMVRPDPFSSKVAISGNLIVEQRDLNGNLLKRVEHHNAVVKTGRNLLRDLVGGFVTAFPSHLGAGVVGSVVDDEDVALASEATRILIISRTQGNSQVTIRAFMGSTVGNGFDYVEAGLFNGAAGDINAVMFSRAVHDSITKSSSNTITYIWTLQFASV